jgi:hypothetical protein
MEITRMKSFLLGTAAAIAVLAAGPASANGPTIAYVPNSLVESTIRNGPWPLHESTGTFKHDASGIVPTSPGPPYTGSGMPYASYCTTAGKLTVNHGTAVMQPYYFPFVRRQGLILEGFFDYRPRNEQEAVVRATSKDFGATWTFGGEALALNPYCPWDATDPDNLNVNVGGAATAYGSSSANAADNGLGHPVVLSVNGTQHLYQLNRANGHIDSDQLVVHTLTSAPMGLVDTLPAYGYVSPLASLGYPTLEATAVATSGLQSPDAMMGSTVLSTGTTTVLYVEKQLNADTTVGYPACGNTPAFALTNLINGKARKPNHDVTTVRVATTTDGINFTDVGAATGLFDPTSTAYNGTRYLGSGSILPLANGHYGMFFGAGNCLDNDSDAFHYLGYAETVSVVYRPTDLLNWQVIYGFDNPILSTDTITDTSQTPARPYPLNAPVVNAHGVDALTASQVAPFTPVAGGYNSNFFSGRVYDPQAIYTDSQTLTIVFAGYNTPQPSNNLGDYRTIGRFKLEFPTGYFKPF